MIAMAGFEGVWRVTGASLVAQLQTFASVRRIVPKVGIAIVYKDAANVYLQPVIGLARGLNCDVQIWRPKAPRFFLNARSEREAPNRHHELRMLRNVLRTSFCCTVVRSDAAPHHMFREPEGPVKFSRCARSTVLLRTGSKHPSRRGAELVRMLA